MTRAAPKAVAGIARSLTVDRGGRTVTVDVEGRRTLCTVPTGGPDADLLVAGVAVDVGDLTRWFGECPCSVHVVVTGARAEFTAVDPHVHVAVRYRDVDPGLAED